MLRRFLSLLMMAVLATAVFAPSVFAGDNQDLQFKAGFYERLRHEFWKNNQDMNSQYYGGGDRNFFRFKTSIWGQADYQEALSFYAKLTNEIKSYNLLGSSGRKMYYSDHRHWDPDEIIFDNLYLDIKKSSAVPVSFRLGRQDLLGLYGENFLICDGTPGDGSRTFYFNALKSSWDIDDKNTLDFLYINNPRDDIWLPVINEDKTPVALNVTAEEGYVLYLKNRSIKDLAFEPYYMFKREDDDYGSYYQSQTGKINTLGVFSKYITAPWTFHAQIADQFGKYGSEDRTALGGYLFADYDLKDALWKPQLSGGYVYLSGDKQGTAKREGWNPLWCRFPIYSELYAQSFQYESGNSYWTNLQMYRLGVTVKPTDKAKFNLSYSFLRANELVTGVSSNYNFSGTGKDRGQLILAKLDYTFNKSVCAYLLGEYFIPNTGNRGFYTKDADPAIFVRTQLEFKF
ncbi:MAG: alginate export family protein [Candidatus Omnitrophica bacterium]|nr:alginate export family protein [Candidatus Omnitrophota bacterium]